MEEEKTIKETTITKHVTLNEKSIEIIEKAIKRSKENNNLDLSYSAVINQALFAWKW